MHRKTTAFSRFRSVLFLRVEVHCNIDTRVFIRETRPAAPQSMHCARIASTTPLDHKRHSFVGTPTSWTSHNFWKRINGFPELSATTARISCGPTSAGLITEPPC